MKTVLMTFCLSLLSASVMAFGNVGPEYGATHGNHGMEEATYCEAREHGKKRTVNVKDLDETTIGQ